MCFFFLTVAAKIEWGKTGVTKNMDGGSFLQIRNNLNKSEKSLFCSKKEI